METFNLNIIPGKTCPVCHASQYDIGRTIRINLFENAAVYTLDGTETVSVSVRKTDGNVVTASVTNTSDSFVEIVTTEQMTACHGANLCELKIEKGADVIGTMNFILEVEQDPLEGGVQSASEIDNLETQVAGMVATEVANQYDSANVIFDPSPVPGHGNGYAVTSEGVASEVSTLNGAIGLKQDATDANLQTTDTTVVGAINELNSGKAKKVLYQEFTGTTTGNGNLVIGGGTFPFSAGVVVGAFRTDAESVVTYYLNTIGDYINFHFTSPLSTWAVIANTQVTVRVFYIPNN